MTQLIAVIRQVSSQQWVAANSAAARLLQSLLNADTGEDNNHREYCLKVK